MTRGWLSPWAIFDPATGLYKWEAEDSTPKWTFPNRNGYAIFGSSSDHKVKVCDAFMFVRAALATYIRAAEDLSAAVPLTFTIDAQPDVPRTITWAFTSHVNITAFSITFTGVNARGEVVTETITQASGWTGETHNAFATITSIIMTARTGTGVGDTMNVGIGSKLGLSNPLPATADVYKCSKVLAAGLATDYSGAGNLTPDATYSVVDVSTGAAIVDADCYTILYKSYL